MKTLLLVAAIVPAFVAGFDNTTQNLTVAVGQTTTKTATTVYYVTVKPGSVTGYGAACSASGCAPRASTISYSNVTETSLETLRLTSITTSIITDVVTPPDTTTTIYHDGSSPSVPTISFESTEMTSQASIPVVTFTVKPVPASIATSEVQSPSRTPKFGALQTLGCYSEPDPISQDNTNLNQTIEACQSACGNGAWSLMALTGGATCYCSDDLPSFDKKVDDAKCNEPCRGDKQQTCGGTGYWQFYQFNPHGDVGNTSSPIKSFATCSTRVVTVYVTSTPDPSTPRYLNTTSTSYPTGWGPPGSSSTLSRTPPPISTSTLPTVTESQSSSTSLSSVITTSRSPTTSAPASTPTVTSFHGSASRAKPPCIFMLFARLLTLNIFAQAHGLEERFYPYPTPINGPLPQATSILPASRFVSEPPGPSVSKSIILMTLTTTMSTTTIPLLSPPISETPSLLISAPAPSTTFVSGSFSTWWSSNTESSPNMTGGPGTYAPWWTSVGNITELQTVTISETKFSSSSASSTLVLTSTIPNVVIVTSSMISTSPTIEVKTSTKMLSMTMTSPAFSGPAMSSAAASDIRLFSKGHAQAAVILMNMLDGCAMFLYILYFM